MKRTSLLFILSLTFVVSLISTGCDDGGKKSNNNNNTNNAVCGNDILETGETCDGTDLGGLTCTDVEGGFTGGTLACTTGCALDTIGCTTGCTDACELDNRVCSVDTLRVCEANAETGCTEWTDTDCTLTSETCQVIGGEAQCASCTDACTLDDERCNDTDDGIEACVVGASGCTEWLNGGCPLPTPACELQAGVPTCVSTCTDECTLDAVQCNLAADGIETCINGAAGCTVWSNTTCDVATPECLDIAGVATCIANGSGESCTDVLTITLPFYTEGTNFNADFTTADMTFTDASCTFGWSMNGKDAVFAVNLATDETIVFTHGGGFDGAIYIQSACDAAGVCLDKADDVLSNATEEILFQAPADGLYYLIVKAWSASPTPSTYKIAAFYYEDTTELTCGDGGDNDLDGFVDCADSDCFGVGPCAIESLCDDGIDNDLDGVIDCVDTDCDSFSRCQPGQSCTDALPVTTFPFNVTGTNLTADFTNSHIFTYSAGGCGTANGSEAVFSVDLIAGQRIKLDETNSSLDAVIRVLGTCTDVTPTCLLSSDSPETNLVFTAPADGTYYVVLENYSSTSTYGYNFTINLIPDSELNCTDGLDDDLDGDIDCADADCASASTCGPENTDVFCADSIDNDADGLTDCADTDCYGHPGCPALVLFEDFNTWPLTGWTIADGGSTADTWQTSATGTARTLNGATGTYAKVDSDAAGSGPTLDEQLISPAFDCTGYTTVTLSFRHYYLQNGSQTGVVNISTDGGTTWNPTPVVSYTASSTNGAVANLDISAQAAGQANVAIRFHYTGSYDWYWLIDDVTVLAQ